jgi:ankyrin repeat protein
LTEGKTPLEVAIILNREIAGELIKAGANIDTRDKSGKTALDIAKSVKRVEIIELLSGSSNQRK